jgi:hypothetical protein
MDAHDVGSHSVDARSASRLKRARHSGSANTYRNTEQIAELLEKLNALTVEVHQHIYHCEE